MNVQLSLDETYADITPVRQNPNSISAFVSIMRGCNNSECCLLQTAAAATSLFGHVVVHAVDTLTTCLCSGRCSQATACSIAHLASTQGR